ncbi:hypothetical protein AB8A21_16725 [Streptomyces sp. BF23-18]|uniref:hypothetical protein n=1 Tax=Streptomyces sp. BF23-18 TaxID=3240282 RepID=UPI0034E4E551
MCEGLRLALTVSGRVRGVDRAGAGTSGPVGYLPSDPAAREALDGCDGIVASRPMPWTP